MENFIVYIISLIIVGFLVLFKNASIFLLLVPLLTPLLNLPFIFVSLMLNGANLVHMVTNEFLSVSVTLIFSIALLLASLKLCKKIVIDKVTLFVLIFQLYLLYSLSWTKSIEYGKLKVFGFAIGGVLPFISIYTLNSYNKIKQSKIPKLLISQSVISVILLIFYNSNNLFSGRATIPSVNSIWNARDIGLGIVILYFNLLKNDKNKSNIPLILLLLFGLFINRSRGPMLALGITVLFLEFKHGNISGSQFINYFRKIFLVLSLIIVLILLIFGSSRYSLTYILSDKNVSGRLDFLSIVNVSLKEKIIGVGAGGFSYILTGMDVRRYPHNLVFEIIVEYGLVGIVFLINMFKKLKFNSGKSTTLGMWYSILIFYFVSSLFSGDLFGNVNIMIPLAMVLSEIPKNKTSNNKFEF